MFRVNSWKSAFAILISMCVFVSACGDGDQATDAIEEAPVSPPVEQEDISDSSTNEQTVENDIDVYGVNESFWAYGWVWHIETISIEHNTAHGRVALIDAEIENLLYEEESVPSDIATLIDGDEKTNLYAAMLTVAPNERESATYEVAL